MNKVENHYDYYWYKSTVSDPSDFAPIFGEYWDMVAVAKDGSLVYPPACDYGHPKKDLHGEWIGPLKPPAKRTSKTGKILCPSCQLVKEREVKCQNCGCPGETQRIKSLSGLP